MAAVFPDLSLTVSQKRWACVLDPTLTLSRFGLLLVKRLGEVMDLWVVRELWHVLDNTQYYLQQPDSLLADRTPSTKVQKILCALREWERVRMETDPAGQRYYWIGDGPVESFLPNDQAPEIVWRYERISCALDRRLGSSTETLAAAFRDAAALTATLDSAFILTQLPEDPAENLPPAICRALEGGGSRAGLSLTRSLYVPWNVTICGSYLSIRGSPSCAGRACVLPYCNSSYPLRLPFRGPVHWKTYPFQTMKALWM
jgi:hypothetical protein